RAEAAAPAHATGVGKVAQSERKRGERGEKQDRYTFHGYLHYGPAVVGGECAGFQARRSTHCNRPWGPGSYISRRRSRTALQAVRLLAFAVRRNHARYARCELLCVRHVQEFVRPVRI